MAEHRTDPAKLPALGRALLFVDKPRNVTRIVYGLYAVCGLLLVAELFISKKPYFEVEYVFGFYGWFGFVMCSLLVIGAKGMRVFLKRREDYYAPFDVESEDFPEDLLGRETIDD